MATRRFIMQKARRHITKMLRPLVGAWFQVLFHSPNTLSVSREYLALPDGPGRFAQDYSCPALLRIPLGLICVHVQDCHLLRLNFPDHSIPHLSTKAWSYNPRYALPHTWFGLFPGRSPLLGESLVIFSSWRY